MSGNWTKRYSGDKHSRVETLIDHTTLTDRADHLSRRSDHSAIPKLLYRVI